MLMDFSLRHLGVNKHSRGLRGRGNSGLFMVRDLSTAILPRTNMKVSLNTIVQLQRTYECDLIATQSVAWGDTEFLTHSDHAKRSAK
jgi:hypothetical protein